VSTKQQDTYHNFRKYCNTKFSCAS